jgi:tRNA nucleotidyltransferase (CCA-adding enzyme)
MTAEGMIMKVFLCGGAVRDFLMGRPVEDRDYVVVGGTPGQMKLQGFKQVGADFPVFLHPVTGDEYALARRERKTGTGYVGFETEFSTDVTLEEDLGRRDLTINSMAQDQETGAYVDPYNGMQDMTDKVLRHSTEAFAEDPVRVLRLARFRARFGPEWSVAPGTHNLIYKMVKKGVLDELTPERVWKEMSRALMEKHPRLFFDTLLETDALKAVFPDLWRLKSALESRRWHPEGDAFEHTMLVLTQSALWKSSLENRYAALVHDLGKGLTPREEMPSHFGHDVKGAPLVREFSDKLTVPAKMRDHAVKATRYHMYMHKLESINPKTYVKMFDDMSILNDPESVNVLYNVGIFDERGRLGSEENEVHRLVFLLIAADAYKSVKFADVFPNGETRGHVIQEKMRQARVKAVSEAKKAYF